MRAKHEIIWISTTDSTNDEVKRHIHDLDNLSVVSALSQTSGRGQRGNIWLSNPGENLTFSIILKYQTSEVDLQKRPRMKAEDQVAISKVTAVSVTDFLREYGIDSKIKYPNDIYVGDRKICGILIEHSVMGNLLTHSIIGIGINVNQCIFDTTLPNPVSMKMCLSKAGGRTEDIDLNECLCRFMNIFNENLCLLDKDRDNSILDQKYISRALLR